MESIIDILVSLITLTVLEVILGVDNLVFLTIASQKLPIEQQSKARRIGLSLAWITRLLLLAFAVWLTQLNTPLFTLFSYTISWRDLFLLLGGVFLLAKATQEIHLEIEEKETKKNITVPSSFFSVVFQIAILDIIFSLDSVLTAVGLTQRFWLMATAITIAIIAMIFASETLNAFIEKRPTIKMLALAFLILIGMMLIADGMHFHIPRGYIYFAMGFSLFVELLNRRKKGRS